MDKTVCRIQCALMNHFRKFPVMKYRYEEDDEPDEFFVPYCWSIIYNSAPHIGWDIANVRLFSIDSYV